MKYETQNLIEDKYMKACGHCLYRMLWNKDLRHPASSAHGSIQTKQVGKRREESGKVERVNHYSLYTKTMQISNFPLVWILFFTSAPK